MGRTSLWWWGDKLDHRLLGSWARDPRVRMRRDTISLRAAMIDIVCDCYLRLCFTCVL